MSSIIMTLTAVAHLLFALCISGCTGSVSTSNVREIPKHLAACGEALGNCAGTSVPFSCSGPQMPVCRYRCFLGRPLQRVGPNGTEVCGEDCPRGSFAGRVGESEECLPNALSCPKGQSRILEGSNWHDTVCGNPEDYRLPTGSWESSESEVLIDTLNVLAFRWIPTLTEDETKLMCLYFSAKDVEGCVSNLESSLASTGISAKKLFHALNDRSLYNTAVKLYMGVVWPLVNRSDLIPNFTIRFIRAEPWWVGEQDALVVQARLIVPMGSMHKYSPRGIVWTGQGSVEQQWLVRGNRSDISSYDPRYDMTAGTKWAIVRSSGFFTHTLDISLIVKGYSCDMFDSVRATVTAMDFDVGEQRIASEASEINCMWRLKLHQACNCTRALLDYTNPRGLCSPECISTPFAHLSKGAQGANNDWTLEITRDAPDTTEKGIGRVLYGSVEPKTERFCLVTRNVFARSPGPKRDAPSAPLDVMRCDVVLVEFDVWTGEPPEGLEERYSHVPVRSLSNEDNVTMPQVYIPVAAHKTLRTIIRKSWGGEVGVKVRFLHSTRGAPRQEEIAAVLDWVVDLHSPRTRAVRVVVIQVNLGTAMLSDFGKIHALYGSKLELIPGLSAGRLPDLIRTRGSALCYKHYRCSQGTERCASIHTVFDKRHSVLYTRPSADPVPECSNVSPSSIRCIVCREGYVIVTCPCELQPVRAEDSAGGLLAIRDCSRPNWYNPTLVRSLTREQEQVEAQLQQTGLLVSSHGAFLDLDTVSVSQESELGCGRVKPGRWSVGRYSPEDPYVISLPRTEHYPERTGLSVFEELCKRSNNRAGIVVTLPSADYITARGCRDLGLINRHVTREPAGSHEERVRYTMPELTSVISDMAKWGVCRYSLGYLDYTFGVPKGVPIFTELSRAITSAATRFRTLHYRYTRTSSFGDGAYSYALVDGVYKLEGGMFFQRVTEETPLTKSFSAVPAMPNLRLGMSSDLNVGASLSTGEPIDGYTVKRVESVPRGAQVVDLNHRGQVVFVDRDRGTMCVHSQPTLVRSEGLELHSGEHGERNKGPWRGRESSALEREEPLRSKLKEYVTDLGALTARTVQPLGSLYCPHAEPKHAEPKRAERSPPSGTHIERTWDCVSATNRSLVDMGDVFHRLGFLLPGNATGEELARKRVAYMAERASALSVSAIVLAVPFLLTLIPILCTTCKGTIYTERGYRKLE
ncbi:hypothetical protein KUCAC02_033100 [Chaenocephalus aceratus]|nr:hypothetical protein KUCAC02_033100 [Chaenocephalus aceratus]